MDLVTEKAKKLKDLHILIYPTFFPIFSISPLASLTSKKFTTFVLTSGYYRQTIYLFIYALFCGPKTVRFRTRRHRRIRPSSVKK